MWSASFESETNFNGTSYILSLDLDECSNRTISGCHTRARCDNSPGTYQVNVYFENKFILDEKDKTMSYCSLIMMRGLRLITVHNFRGWDMLSSVIAVWSSELIEIVLGFETNANRYDASPYSASIKSFYTRLWVVVACR